MKHGFVKRYKITNDGTYYSSKTPDAVIEEIEKARHAGYRIRVYYRDQKTGRCWMDEALTTGTVGRSTGRIKIPLLIATRRSLGGPALLDSCIIKIASSGRTLYQHPSFNMPRIDIVPSHVPGYEWGVDFDHSRRANFKTRKQAERYAAKMSGETQRQIKQKAPEIRGEDSRYLC